MNINTIDILAYKIYIYIRCESWLADTMKLMSRFWTFVLCQSAYIYIYIQCNNKCQPGVFAARFVIEKTYTITTPSNSISIAISKCIAKQYIEQKYFPIKIGILNMNSEDKTNIAFGIPWKNRNPLCTESEM